MSNTLLISGKDLIKYLEELNTTNSVNCLSQCTDILKALLDNLNTYGMDSDFDLFNNVLEEEQKKQYLKFLSEVKHE